MVRHAAIRIGDHLATGEARVGERSAHHEPSRWVDVHLGVRRHPFAERLARQGLKGAADLFDRRLRAMLCRDDEGRYLLRRIAHVSHADLRLAVGSQPLNGPGDARLGESTREALCQHEWQRQPFGCFVRGVAVDDPLVAGAEHAVVAHHPHGDVAALRVNGHAHGAGIGVNPLFCRLVPNITNDAPCHLLNLAVT